jgi:hypothetical protein
MEGKASAMASHIALTTGTGTGAIFPFRAIRRERFVIEPGK